MRRICTLNLANSLLATLVAGSYWALMFYSFYFFDDPKGQSFFPHFSLTLLSTVVGGVFGVRWGLKKNCSVRHPYLAASAAVILYAYLTFFAYLATAVVTGYAAVSGGWDWLGLPFAPLAIFLYGFPVLFPVLLILALIFGSFLSRIHHHPSEVL